MLSDKLPVHPRTSFAVYEPTHGVVMHVKITSTATFVLRLPRPLPGRVAIAVTFFLLLLS
jgi:hypothetical protein